MDVKTCNVVVRFDRIPEFRSYVQSKGRARAKPSRYIIMLEEEDAQKAKCTLEHYRQIDRDAITMCHNGTLSSEDEEDDEEDDDDLPYLVHPEDPANSPRVTSLSAISLLSKYVQVRENCSSDVCVYCRKEYGTSHFHTY